MCEGRTSPCASPIHSSPCAYDNDEDLPDLEQLFSVIDHGGLEAHDVQVRRTFPSCVATRPLMRVQVLGVCACQLQIQLDGRSCHARTWQG